MSNPKNESEKIQNLISDVRSQLINIEASMELAAIAASTTSARRIQRSLMHLHSKLL